MVYGERKALWKPNTVEAFQNVYIYVCKEFKQSNHAMAETMPQLDILCHQVELTVPGMGYIFQPKRSHRPLQTSQVITKAIGYTPQLYSQALLLEDTTYIIKPGEMEVHPTTNFTPSVHGVRRKKKVTINITWLQTLLSTIVTCLQDILL